MVERVAEEAYDTLDQVLQELDEAESESMRVACDIISHSAEQFESEILDKLAEILSQWGFRPSVEILKMLKEAFGSPDDNLEEEKKV